MNMRLSWTVTDDPDPAPEGLSPGDELTINAVSGIQVNGSSNWCDGPINTAVNEAPVSRIIAEGPPPTVLTYKIKDDEADPGTLTCTRDGLTPEVVWTAEEGSGFGGKDKDKDKEKEKDKRP
jgi:hypothetical protein